MLKAISLLFLISFTVRTSAMQRKGRIKQSSTAQEETYEDIYCTPSKYCSGMWINATRIQNRALIGILFNSQTYGGYEITVENRTKITRDLSPEKLESLFKHLLEIKKNQ